MATQKDPISLRIGYWLAVHRDRLRTWWAISIIAADLVLIAIFAYTFAGYSFSTVKTVRTVAAMGTPLVSPAVRQKLDPKELVTGEVAALARGKQRYDLVVPVENANPQWSAVQIRYRFSFGQDTREERASLWPGQKSFLTQLNVAGPADNSQAKAEVQILGVSWLRPQTLDRYHNVSFDVTSEKLVPVAGLASGVSATRYTATLKNNSVYTFARTRFGVVLKNGTAIVAAGEVVLPRFPTFAELPIEVTWLQALPLAVQATVFPVFDLLDAGSYASET